MDKMIGIAKVRENLAELVNQVAFGGQRYVVERRGKPLAALISVTEYHELIELLEQAGVNDKVRGISVRIRFDGDRYFVSDDCLDLYGVGDSLDKARQDYWLAVKDYYADLLANADRLADHLQEHLTFLCQVFEDEA